MDSVSYFSHGIQNVAGGYMSKFGDWVYDGTVEDEPKDFGTKVYNELLDIYENNDLQVEDVYNDKPEWYNGIMVGKPLCEMVNVYNAVKKSNDRYYDQEFEGNHVAAAEAKKESNYYKEFLDSTECPKYPGF